MTGPGKAKFLLRTGTAMLAASGAAISAKAYKAPLVGGPRRRYPRIERVNIL
jgi:hypothetical protein